MSPRVPAPSDGAFVDAFASAVDAAIAAKLDALVDRLAARLELRLGSGASGSGLLDVHSAAAFLSISPRTVYKKAARGELPCVKVGAALRFRADDLESYVETRSSSADRIAAQAALARHRSAPIDSGPRMWYKALRNGRDGKADHGPEAKKPRHPLDGGGRRRTRTTGSDDRLDTRRGRPAPNPNRGAPSTRAEAPEEVVRSPEEAP